MGLLGSSGSFKPKTVDQIAKYVDLSRDPATLPEPLHTVYERELEQSGAPFGFYAVRPFQLLKAVRGRKGGIGTYQPGLVMAVAPNVHDAFSGHANVLLPQDVGAASRQLDFTRFIGVDCEAATSPDGFDDFLKTAAATATLAFLKGRR